MAIKAITIDFYGTLVRDNNAVVREICRRISQSAYKMLVSPAEVGMAWWRQIEDMLMEDTFYDSKTMEKSAIKKILTQYNSAENLEEIYSEIIDSLKCPILYPDTHIFLETLPLPYCLVVNGDLDILKDAINHIQIDTEHIVCSSTAKCYKPSHEIFKKAIQILDVNPDEILHVGKSLKYDIIPAKKLGMNACWINRSKKPIKGNLRPDVECGSLLDLKMIIK